MALFGEGCGPPPFPARHDAFIAACALQAAELDRAPQLILEALPFSSAE